MNKRRQLRRMRRQGMSINLIAETVGMGYTGVRHHVKDIAIGKPTRTRGQRNGDQPPPLPLPPSANLSYLIGVIAGDGFIEQKPRTCRLWITCDNEQPHLITRYEILVSTLLPGNVKVTPRRDKACTDITLYCLHVPHLLGLRAGSKKDGPFPLPAWIFESEEFLIPFVRGLMETDGGVYYRFTRSRKHYVFLTFTADIESINIAFVHATRLLGFEFQEISKTRLQVATKTEAERFMQTIAPAKAKAYTAKPR